MEARMKTKEEIRKCALKVRAEIGKAERRAADKEIAERLIREDFYKNARCIYCYASFRDEAGTTEMCIRDRVCKVLFSCGKDIQRRRGETSSEPGF